MIFGLLSGRATSGWSDEMVVALAAAAVADAAPGILIEDMRTQSTTRP